ncbi:MAG: hypothetical protein ACLQLC_19150 [Candidatus Sulfotelmatobacter sp.]
MDKIRRRKENGTPAHYLPVRQRWQVEQRVCFDELRRAQEVSPRPNFLVLVGDRYGWQPPAESITAAEFPELEKAAGQFAAHSEHGTAHWWEQGD